MTALIRTIVAAGLCLSPVAASAEETDPEGANIRDSIELALAAAHCLAYYETIAVSTTADPMSQEIAELGASILELSLMLEKTDAALAEEISGVIKPGMANEDGEQLFEIYDSYCDDVAERFTD